MTPRATRALEILRTGGKFRYGLTTGWQGREQFKWSLVGHKGYGGATYYELVKAGYDFNSLPSGFTGSATYYTLKE